MTKAEKTQYIDDLAAQLKEAGVFYLADTSGLTVETVNNLRRKCFSNNIQLRVVKNTLLAKAMEKVSEKDRCLAKWRRHDHAVAIARSGAHCYSFGPTT